jgi:hypothetical protein
MKARAEFLSLTPKGLEALRGRTPKLDTNSSNILSLIQQGATSEEAILQRSKFPREVVLAALRLLLRDRFVASATSDRTASGGATDSAAASQVSASVRLTLKLGVSPSQARFTLTNFCLDNFGTSGQELADVIGLCSDVFSLQQALNAIRTELDKRCPGQLGALFDCVKEINETDF